MCIFIHILYIYTVHVAYLYLTLYHQTFYTQKIQYSRDYKQKYVNFKSKLGPKVSVNFIYSTYTVHVHDLF